MCLNVTHIVSLLNLINKFSPEIRVKILCPAKTECWIFLTPAHHVVKMESVVRDLPPHLLLNIENGFLRYVWHICYILPFFILSLFRLVSLLFLLQYLFFWWYTGGDFKGTPSRPIRGYFDVVVTCGVQISRIRGEHFHHNGWLPPPLLWSRAQTGSLTLSTFVGEVPVPRTKYIIIGWYISKYQNIVIN